MLNILTRVSKYDVTFSLSQAGDKIAVLDVTNSLWLRGEIIAVA